MILKLFVFAFMTLILSNCSHRHPLPIKEPVGVDANGNRATPDFRKGGLIPATNLVDLLDNTKIYSDSYRDVSVMLLKREYNSSDIAFLGGIIGVIGGVAESITTAIAGGVMASGSSLYSQRYQFQVQSLNYRKAAKAMNCMYVKLYEGKVIYSTLSNFSEVVSFGNHKINEVRYKLEDLQYSVTLAEPDLTNLENALKKKQETETQLIQSEIQLKSNKGIAGFTAAQQLQAETEYEDALIVNLNAELGKCVASFN